MKRFQNFGLKKKLFVMFVALVILPLLLLGVLTYSLSAYSVKKNMAYSLTSAAKGKMAELDYFYGTINNILTTTAGSEDMLEFFAYQSSDSNNDLFGQSLSELSSKFDYVLNLYNNYLDSIAVIPYERTYYQMVRRAPSSRHYTSELFSRSNSETAWRKENELGMKWRFFKNPVGGEVIGTVYTSIFHAGQDTFLGTLSCIINMEYINQSVEALAADGTVAIFTAGEGMPVSSSVDEAETRSFLESDSHKGDTVFVDGHRYLRVAVYSPDMGWGIQLFSPYDSFLEDLHTIPFIILIASFVYFMYSLVLVQHIFHVIYHPIKRLSDEMSHITYESISIQNEPRAKDELKELEIGFNQMKQEITQLIENVKREQEQKKEMEIRALQAQIMPHFLYNTLNSIKALINMGRSEEASQMLVAFISLLRISVDTAEECISLYEEISYLRHYILIMNYRYGQSIQLQVDADESLFRCKIPKFILQPVVENSIIHGYECVNGISAPTISIRIWQNGDKIMVTITDNGNGIPPEKLERLNHGEEIEENARRFSHIGIVNIANRIRLLYGEEYGLLVESMLGKGTTVTVTIPKYF